TRADMLEELGVVGRGSEGSAERRAGDHCALQSRAYSGNRFCSCACISLRALKRWLRTVDSRQPRILAISADGRSSIWFMTKIVFCFGERQWETVLKICSISLRWTITPCSASEEVFTSRRFE